MFEVCSFFLRENLNIICPIIFTHMSWLYWKISIDRLSSNLQAYIDSLSYIDTYFWRKANIVGVYERWKQLAILSRGMNLPLTYLLSREIHMQSKVSLLRDRMMYCIALIHFERWFLISAFCHFFLIYILRHSYTSF